MRVHEPMVTERGVLQPGGSNSFTTRNESLAQEIQQRYPEAIVAEHDDHNNGRSERPTFTVPALPYETEWDRRHKKQEQGNG